MVAHAKALLQDTLDDLVEMREREGKRLAEFISTLRPNRGNHCAYSQTSPIGVRLNAKKFSTVSEN